MVPGPDEIVACPHCGRLTKCMTLLSGNTFDESLWSDGKRVAPMLPQPPVVVKCRHCAKCHWLTNAKRVGSIDRCDIESGIEEREIEPSWLHAEEVEEPSEEEYYQILDAGFATDVDQEKRIRILAWWRRNDPYREAAFAEAEKVPSMSAGCKKNLEALGNLLRETAEDDRIMKAEVMRELGRFDSAKALLTLVRSEEFQSITHQIRSLCVCKDATVRELKYDGFLRGR